MFGFHREPRPAKLQAKQKIAEIARQGRIYDQYLHEVGEEEKQAEDPEYVMLEYIPDPFDPVYYVNANQTFVSDEVKKEVEEEVGENAPDSVILRRALVRDGGALDPTKLDVENQAHHIVEMSNVAGKKILEWAGIEPNSAVNGVFLPSKEVDGIRDNLTIHLGSHTRDYMKSIYKALRAVKENVKRSATLEEKRQAVVDLLNRIRYVLLTERVPLNGGSDPGYRPEGTVTVEEIFECTGLFD